MSRLNRQHCPEGKTPVLVVHVNGKHHQLDCVIVSLQFWRDLCVEQPGVSGEVRG